MSRNLLATFLCIILVCAGALGWLGWQVLEQDRSLERQRMQERLEQAADRIAASLERSLSEFESSDPPNGVVVLKATEQTVDVHPSGGLLFYPGVSESTEPPAAAFADGEKIEFQRNAPLLAADFFRALARSPDPEVRAGALLRLGRNLHKAGRNEDALAVYSQLAQLHTVQLLGVPAELMAREARASVLEAMGRRDELRKEASLMDAALQGGRWRLPRAVWAFHVEEARRWLGAGQTTEYERDAIALSSAAEWVFEQWQQGRESKGRRILQSEGKPVLISWKSQAERLVAVLAGPGYVARVWDRALPGQRVRGALVDADGQVIIGRLDKSAWQAVRTAAATGLPGNLHVSSDGSSGEFAGGESRRRLLLAGFAVLAVVLLAGSYFILRSIAREQAVARMQSEFVSAVSHEFRTPFTSLRQLSDMLVKGRIPGDELRQEAYEILSRESERLQRLVESVLDFGRMEARSFRYNPEEFEPAAMVRDLIREFQEKAAAQGYRVELVAGEEYPHIRADREALGLALWNLLDNAVKYSPECRTVWVEMMREGNRLAIHVRDRGMGIPTSEQKEIFKKFVRGEGSRTSGIKGTGIGLAMAWHVVEAHEGEIRLESKPGHGSTFTILLPLEKAA